MKLNLKNNMEKFSLKWNDFQTSASQAFQLLRKEEDFFDVTLVSDDEVHLSAHKLVLSASSNFFKSILKKSSNSNPLIFMNGINSINLQFVLALHSYPDVVFINVITPPLYNYAAIITKYI